LAVRAVFSVMAYLVAVIAPLVFAAIGASRPYHGFWTNFSVALGFVGLAMMGLEFALVARFEAMAAPFGQDALLQFVQSTDRLRRAGLRAPPRRPWVWPMA
jgi:predicted ferric reductase